MGDLQVVCSEAVRSRGEGDLVSTTVEKQRSTSNFKCYCCTLSPKRVSSSSLETPILDQAQILIWGRGARY